ncbi:MAG: hypothetical protein LBT76_02380, partial [Tannerella sp.]|nr:hypothetical protein [Tannerella sp.]
HFERETFHFEVEAVHFEREAGHFEVETSPFEGRSRSFEERDPVSHTLRIEGEYFDAVTGKCGHCPNNRPSPQTLEGRCPGKQ